MTTSLNLPEEKQRDLLRLLAIALHKLGGEMEIQAGDYFAVQGKVFFSTRNSKGLGKLSLVDDVPARAFGEPSI